MIGNRIKFARTALGYTLRSLAKKVDLSHTMIKKYEDNEVTPSSDILLKLSGVLDVRTAYFFKPVQFELKNIQYRKNANLPKALLGKIKLKILSQFERRIELENLLPKSPIKTFSPLPIMKGEINGYDDIEAIAAKMRQKWELSLLEPLPSLIDIFEKYGIKVFEVNNQKSAQFDGLACHINDTPVVVIDNQWPGDRQRFTLAHELAHLILQEQLPSHLDKETCCDRFAAAFLLPKAKLIDILGEHRDHVQIEELNLVKQEFGISMLTVLHRLKDISIISNTLYRKVEKEFKQKNWVQHEPMTQCPKEKTYIFKHMVLHAFAENHISESKSAELMDMSLVSFREMRVMEPRNANYCQ